MDSHLFFRAEKTEKKIESIRAYILLFGMAFLFEHLSRVLASAIHHMHDAEVHFSRTIFLLFLRVLLAAADEYLSCKRISALCGSAIALYSTQFAQ